MSLPRGWAGRAFGPAGPPAPGDCLGFGPIPVRELSQPAAPVAGREAMGVFLGWHLPWQPLDPGKTKQG